VFILYKTLLKYIEVKCMYTQTRQLCTFNFDIRYLNFIITLHTEQNIYIYSSFIKLVFVLIKIIMCECLLHSGFIICNLMCMLMQLSGETEPFSVKALS